MTLRAFFQALLRMASSIACRLRFQDFQCIAHFCTMALCPLQKPQNKNTLVCDISSAWFAEATSSSLSNPQSSRKRMAKDGKGTLKPWSIEACIQRVLLQRVLERVKPVVKPVPRDRSPGELWAAMAFKRGHTAQHLCQSCKCQFFACFINFVHWCSLFSSAKFSVPFARK